MALQYTTSDGQTLIVPGAYSQAQVVATPSNVAANGILMVLGEADSGPSYAEESDITVNSFGPDQKADIIAKYGSGALVDAYVGAVTASNDNNIKGSFTRFIPIKTNTSVKAAATLPAIGGGTYANLVAKSAGKPGNLITRTVTASQTEVAPSTGDFVLASPQVTTTLKAVVNGGAVETTANLVVGTTPTVLAGVIAALGGLTVTGAVARGLITPAIAVSVGSVVGYSATFTITTLATNWVHNPSVGDILQIPAASQFATANHGTYVVQAFSNTTITALKVIDATGTGVTRTAPATDTVAAAVATDIEAYSPVSIKVSSGAVVPGKGKTLELANDTASFANLAWSYNTSTLAMIIEYIH